MPMILAALITPKSALRSTLEIPVNRPINLDDATHINIGAHGTRDVNIGVVRARRRGELVAQIKEIELRPRDGFSLLQDFCKVDEPKRSIERHASAGAERVDVLNHDLRTICIAIASRSGAHTALLSTSLSLAHMYASNHATVRAAQSMAAGNFRIPCPSSG